MTALTQADITEMKRRAEAATPGKWKNVCFAVFSGRDKIAHTGMGQLPPSRSHEAEANAAHIAASNPQAVLALIAADAAKAERIAELEAALSAESAKIVLPLWCLDISKAPRDGTDILVECFDTEERFVVYWSGNLWRYATAEDGTAIGCEPNAWMPLPSDRAAALLSDKGGAEHG